MSQTIQLDPIAALMLSIIVALWIAAAVAAIIMGLRRDAVAKARAHDIERQVALLASAPALPVYADTIRRWVGPRPSLKAAAADRLAVYYARVALTMAPAGLIAAAAREMLAHLPMI